MKNAIPIALLAFVASAVVVSGPFAVAEEQPAAPAALSNADVIKLVRAGLSDDLIATAIRRAERRDFDLSADALIELKGAGVSSQVLMTMLEWGGAPARPVPPSQEKQRPEPRRQPRGSEEGLSGKAVGFIAGGAVAAGVAAVAISASGNDAPERVSLAITPAGEALVAATQMTFTGSAVDPEGDPLTFTWDFGDGSRAQGSTVTHVYESEGNFNVTLAVEDSGGNRTDAQGRVRARTLTGLWSVFTAGKPLGSAQFTQIGPVLEGFITGPANLFVGRVADPRRVSLKFFAAACGAAFNLTGAANEALDVMSLSSRSPNCAGEPFDLVLSR